MSESIDIESIRAEALRKLGRNVVNFQKVETCLKYLFMVSNIQGTPTNLADRQRKKATKVRKASLGTLAKAFHRNAFGDESKSEVPWDLSEFWISFSMKIDADADAVKHRKRALSSLVSERNKLIHQDLVHFDHNSPQSCRDLIHILDAQNARILQQLSELKLLIDAFKASSSSLQSLIESDEFLRHIMQLDPHDA